MNHGWFAMKHGVSRHPLMAGRPERIAIWVWLVDNAAWCDVDHDICGKTVRIKRGQVAVSQRRLADEVGVGRQVVRTFLDRLIAEQMVNPDVTHGRTVVTLCNYDKYQSVIKQPNPPPNPRLTHDQPIKEQNNNIPVGDDDKSSPNSATEISTVTGALWSIGKDYLSKHGVKNGGGIIGKWRSQAGSDAKVLEAIEVAQKSGTQDPVPYISKIISNGNKGNGKTWRQRKDEDDSLSTDEWVMRHV